MPIRTRKPQASTVLSGIPTDADDLRLNIRDYSRIDSTWAFRATHETLLQAYVIAGCFSISTDSPEKEREQWSGVVEMLRLEVKRRMQVCPEPAQKKRRKDGNDEPMESLF
jgi:hypothetical protein